jgi:hypothetical protein
MKYEFYYYAPTLEVSKIKIAAAEQIQKSHIAPLYFDAELKNRAGDVTLQLIYNKAALKYDTAAITISNTIYTPYGTFAYNYAKINNDVSNSLTTYVAGFDNAKQMLVTRTILPITSLDPPGQQKRKIVLTTDF